MPRTRGDAKPALRSAAPRNATADLVELLDQHAVPFDPHTSKPRGESSGLLKVETPDGARFYELSADLPEDTKAQIEAMVATSLKGDVAVLRVLSPQVMRSVDRAVRSPDGWVLPPNDQPMYEDASNKYVVELRNDNVKRDALWDSVKTLNPRVADVWRLVTAQALEHWTPGMSEPPAVWLDVRDLLSAMGYQQHKKGGWKPEHIQAAVKALRTLDDMWVTIPSGTKVYPVNPLTKKRKQTVLTAHRRHRVMVTVAFDELRDLFGESFPLRWQLKPGTWINDYPREISVLLKALVSMPAQGATQVWAKAIGMELSFVYSSRTRGAIRVQVRHLLERSGLMGEVEAWVAQRNSARARQYFEAALELLESLHVCRGWQYDAADFARIEAATRLKRFDVWLESHVSLVEPDYLRGLELTLDLTPPTSN
jgi:hypothetical protein